MALSETTTRVVVAAIGIPVAVLVVYLGGWALVGMIGVIAVLACLEFYRLAETKGVRPLRGLGAALAALFVVMAMLARTEGPDAARFGTLLIVGALVTATLSIWRVGVAGQPLLSVSATLTGALYTGALLSFAVFLRYLPGHESAWHGAALLFAPILLTWASDTFAYFVGRSLGTRKLIPSVSPGKTVQGAVGAIIGAVVTGMAYSLLLASFSTYQLSVVQGALLGLAVSVVAQIGDLAESLFKRDAGVKDSGRLLPGHGGALDRFDSLLFALPLGYYFFRFVVGSPYLF